MAYRTLLQTCVAERMVAACHGTLLDCFKEIDMTLNNMARQLALSSGRPNALITSATVLTSAQGRSPMNTRFTVVDETDHELWVQCEINGLAGKVIWQASVYDASSLQAVLNGEAVDQDAVAGHVQAEVLDRGIFARS